MKVIADHATARHTSQMSTDFSFTLPPPVVSVSCFSKLRHCLTRGERFGNSTVGSGTPAVEHSRRSERVTKERRTRSGPPRGSPTTFLVGPRGLEPRTSPLSGVRSHHLS